MNDTYQLTDIQMAYLLGRNSNIYLGGNSTHFYAEIITKLSPQRFETAFNKVIKHQPMLRTIILPEGVQKTLKTVPAYQINVFDICNKSLSEQERIILDKREATSHRIFKSDVWPLFSIEMYKVNEEDYRLIVDFDMMIVDGLSIEIMINNIIMYYEYEELIPAEVENTFRDYITEFKKVVADSQAKDERFWDEQVRKMPLGPELPISVEEGKIYTFSQKEYVIDAKTWGNIKHSLSQKRVLPAMYILASYSKMLSKFCNQKGFTINLTTTNRRGRFGKYADVIGDFTETIPIDVYFNRGQSVLEVAKEAQRRLLNYRKHSTIGGTRIMKKFAEYNKLSNGVPFPVVFTSMLFDSAQSGWNKLGERVYQISQTPQVILDNNVTERQKSLILHWDYLEGCFETEIISEMFEFYTKILLNAFDDKAVECETKIWTSYNDTEDKSLPDKTLQQLFAEKAKKFSERTALICGNEEITYGELEIQSNIIAADIIEKYGAHRGFVLEAHRSIQTVEWMLGVLKTGGFYIPVEIGWPENRKQYILNNSKAEAIINPNREKFLAKIDKFKAVEDNIDALAYIIYTSGSTGAPKGVAISQKAAANTILDINRRFGITEKDVIIGISSYCFDLSVYDIYGALASGAACVIMKNRADIREYNEILNKYPISVWNSVPAILGMFTENSALKKSSMRKILLSGDWIPLDLPEKAKTCFENADIISLGGATEASIWSIYYPIDRVEKGWSSIPYGYPLANQNIYVMDYEDKLCPCGVDGEICIGGKGVAEGYLNDEVKTDAQFFVHPQFGRIYKTGDFGCMSREGYVVFKGRKDDQIKLHGYRVELGEIENKMKNFAGVRDVAVIVDDNDGKSNLVGYIVPETVESTEISDYMKNACKEAEMSSVRLPEEISIDEYRGSMERLDVAAIGIMAEGLIKIGAVNDEGKIMTIEEMLGNNCISISYRKVLKQWLKALDENGYITRKDGANFLNKSAFMNVDEIFDEVINRDYLRYWKDFLGFVLQCRENIKEILQGTVNPVTILFPDGKWSRAENYYRKNPVAEYYNQIVAKAIGGYVAAHKGCTKVLEVGAGTGGTSYDIFRGIAGFDVEYTYTDLTSFFTDKAKKMFAEYDFIKYGIYSIDDDPQEQGYELGNYDIIVGANVLHDATVVSKALIYLSKLLKRDGMFVVLETTESRLIQKVSVGLIEGFSNYSDDRVERSQPLMSVADWKKAFTVSGCSTCLAYPPANINDYDQHVIIASPDKKCQFVSTSELKEYLKGELPSYMIPKFIYKIDEIPLSSNGKVRKDLLPRYTVVSKGDVKREINVPKTKTERIIYQIISDALHNEKIDINDNFFEMGIDSLKAISIVTACNDRGLEFSLLDLYSYSSVHQLATMIDERSASAGNNQKLDYRLFAVEPHYNNERYELNDIQRAYLYGRNPAFELGNISTHYYAEFEVELDIDRLEESFNKEIEHQSMLRTIIYDDGTQQILEKVEPYKIIVEEDSALKKIREELSHKMHETGNWPMFELKAVKTGENKYTLCFSLDVMLSDGASIFLMWNEIAGYYNGKTMKKLKFCFSDYMESLRALENSSIYFEDAAYWTKKAEDFPVCVQLPYKASFASVKKPHFKRMSAVFSKAEWDRFTEIARQRQLTPSSLLCSVYVSVLSKYSNSSHFSINMTVFNRYPFYERINDIVGDFTSTCILDIHTYEDLWEQTLEIQKVIFEGMDHRSYDGIRFIRQLSNNNENPLAAIIPVIFTCALFDADISELNSLGRISYMISQTSQVALDNQATIMNGELYIAWDYVEQIFDEELISEMFEVYVELIRQIIAGRDKPAISDAGIELFVEKYNQTRRPYIPITLDGLFAEQLKKTPDAEAVLCGDRVITYTELNSMANQIAKYLVKRGCTGKGVAVYDEKTPEIVASILGILKVGGFYVPVSPDFPEARIGYIMNSSECDMLITTDIIKNEVLGKYDSKFETVLHEPEDRAYIIYTSGSTGKPKGVVINHGAAANTILDINRRFSVVEGDRIIGLSSFSFDLSVYDLFGSLSTGAALVLVSEYRDMHEIKRIIRTKNITFWNSVPAIMQMTVETLREEEHFDTVKNVLLSGDWIPLELPEKIKDKFPVAEICSLGGATEASIWSIYYPVNEVDSEWKSIPYGYPLDNQEFYVLDEHYRPCPFGVRGELCIGGIGLADGYIGNEDETAAHFIQHIKYGRIYRTGDFGIFHREGYIEFLGRADEQIKLHGYRIELEEISDVLKQHESVQNAITIITDGESHQIVSYIIPNVDNSATVADASFWKKVLETGRATAEKVPAEISAKRYGEFNDILCNDSLVVMLDAVRTLYELSFGKKLENAEINIYLFIKKSAIRETYTKVIRRWFTEFEKENLAKQISKDVFLMGDARALTSLPITSGQFEFGDEEKANFGESLNFLNLCKKNMVALLTGKETILNLLFPEGKWDVAENLYRTNPIAEYFNTIVAEIIAVFVDGKRDVKILETGAGIGGTTASVLKRLENCDISYMYTDLSTFFTDTAKKIYAQYADKIIYDIFNINLSPQEQGYDLEQYDVIMAANMLHDAKYLNVTLKYIRNMLKPGGMIIFLEQNRNNRLQMITTSMIDGFSDYNDFRLKQNAPLLTAEQWLGILKENGFYGVESFPTAGSENELYGQSVLVAHKDYRNEFLSKEKVRAVIDYSRKYLAKYMVPGRIIQLDSFPLSANGKVSKKLFPLPKATSERIGKSQKPKNEMERVLLKKWAEVLGTEEFSVTDDFYKVGGDSLKAIQLISNLNTDKELDIRKFMEGVSIREIAAYLEEENITIY